jgi:hypothetical protein
MMQQQQLAAAAAQGYGQNGFSVNQQAALQGTFSFIVFNGKIVNHIFLTIKLY